MTLLGQVTNSLKYMLHKATYDPNAEEFAKKQAELAQREAKQREGETAETKAANDKAIAEAKAAAEQAAAEKKAEERKTFRFGRLFGQIFGVVTMTLLVFLLCVGGVLGASLATNLNVYRNIWYRILYAIYGFLFFWIVIPYVFGYRWYWKGKQTRFYSILPLIPYHLDNKWTQLLLSWMSFKPDDQIDALKEWHH